jgi:hypothetical protein
MYLLDDAVAVQDSDTAKSSQTQTQTQTESQNQHQSQNQTQTESQTILTTLDSDPAQHDPSISDSAHSASGSAHNVSEEIVRARADDDDVGKPTMTSHRDVTPALPESESANRPHSSRPQFSEDGNGAPSSRPAGTDQDKPGTENRHGADTSRECGGVSACPVIVVGGADTEDALIGTSEVRGEEDARECKRQRSVG